MILQVEDLKKLKGQVFSFDTETTLPRSPGIYAVFCGKWVYAGGTSDLQKRKAYHKADLLSGKHRNANLQEEFNREEKFTFVVLEHYSPGMNLEERENYWIYFLRERYSNICNVTDASGKRFFPVSEETKKKISEHHKLAGIKPPGTKGMKVPGLWGNQNASKKGKVK